MTPVKARIGLAHECAGLVTSLKKNSRSLYLLPLLVVACSGGGDDEGNAEAGPVVVRAPSIDSTHERLSDWGLFTDLKAQVANEGLVEFAPIVPLYADEAMQRRFAWFPEGSQIGYEPTARWKLPAGAILVKTFAYPVDARDPAAGERKIETRILLNHGADGFRQFVYLWNDVQRDANREVAGDTVNVEWIDLAGKTQTLGYSVPNVNECSDCHGIANEDSYDTALPGGGIREPLGLRTAQLDRDFDYGSGAENQLAHFASLGLLDAEPEPASERAPLFDPFGKASISDRARSYFDGNCSHCHSEAGSASGTGLWLNYPLTDPETGNPTHWGVCKMPTSAGGATCELKFDVVPGNADESVLLCRVSSEVPKIRMPASGSKLPHAAAVGIIREWINAMPAKACIAETAD